MASTPPVDTESFAALVARMGDLLDDQDAALRRVLVQTMVGAGPYSLTEADHSGKQIRIQHTDTVVVNLPVNAAVGTIFLVRQTGTGQLKFVPGSGSTLNHRLAHNATAGQHGCVRLTCEANVSGTAAQWWLDGDTGQVP